MVGFAHTWGEHRVFFRMPGEQRISSLPASWTDVEEPDAFTSLAGGRSRFRVDDLVTLRALVDELSQAWVSGELCR